MEEQRVNAPVPEFLRRYVALKGEAALEKISGDATLFVEGVPQRFPCGMMATHLLHAAQDGGFSQICILKGPRHKHYFKVYDLVRHMKAWCGPSLFSFKGHQDCWIDEKRKLWQVGWQPKPNAKVVTATK